MCRCEDDLTHKLAEIIKANSRLKKQEENGAPQHIIREFTALLQFHVTTYFDNTRPGMPVANQRGGRPIKSISQRLKVGPHPLLLLPQEMTILPFACRSIPCKSV